MFIYFKFYILTISYIYHLSKNFFSKINTFHKRVNVTKRKDGNQAAPESLCILPKIIVYGWLSFPSQCSHIQTGKIILR